MRADELTTKESPRPAPAAVIRRWGNTLELSSPGGLPPGPEALSAARACLTYTHRRYLTSGQRRLEGRSSPLVLEDRGVFDLDAAGRLVTCAGFLARLGEALAAAGVSVAYKDVTPAADPDPCRPDKRAAERCFRYRARQEECLDALLAHRMGVVKAPTGFGKMAMLTMACLAMPHARIDVTSKRVAVVESLVERLSEFIPGVGQVGGGANRPGRRVTVYTADSLKKSPADADVLLADEGHELAADSYAAQLARYRLARMFTFTASPEGRFDGTDVRLEGLFGRPVFEMSYPEAVALGLVVPIRIEWVPVDAPYNPVSGVTHDVERKRRAFWANDARNDLVAASARDFGDAQVLVLVETLEHVVHLLPRLPGFTPVFASCEEQDLRRYRSRGLIDGSFPVPDKRARSAMKRDYEAGRLRRVVATGVWAVGVNFTSLGALVRADGGSSEIASVQLPGRVSRLDAASGKEVGVVRDFQDGFDEGCRAKARTRFGHYRKMGWEQVVVGAGA